MEDHFTHSERIVIAVAKVAFKRRILADYKTARVPSLNKELE